MKNYKFLSIVILQLFFFQASFAQSPLKNGRAAGAQATAPQQVEEKTKTPSSVETNGAFSDFDVPGEQRVASKDWFYPEDMDNHVDELNASASPQEMTQRINDMQDQLNALIQYNEQLRLENQAIKKSLNICCVANASGLETSDAYILQNAPNPFRVSSEVSYFVPADAAQARIDISSVSGELLHSFNVDKTGFGTVNIDGANLQTGTYVYALLIGDELIDSKVMIITQ